MSLSLRLMKAGSWLGGLLCVLLACGAARGAPAGPGLGYATYLGGSDWDDVLDLAVDASGNVWVVGNTISEKLPFAPGALLQKGRRNGFLAKFSLSGKLLFIKTFPVGSDSQDDYSEWGVNSIALTESGEAWIAGATDMENFPIVGEAFQKTFAGGDGDAFLAKFSSSGELIYSTFLGVKTGIPYTTSLPTATVVSGLREQLNPRTSL